MPGLVRQAEAGDLDGSNTVDLLRRYVRPLLPAVPTLVLGCSHYPFLRNALIELVGPDTVLIDTGAAVARQVGVWSMRIPWPATAMCGFTPVTCASHL